MEIWKDIKNYEGLYSISNYGRIKGLRRTVSRKGANGFHEYHVEEQILSGYSINLGTSQQIKLRGKNKSGKFGIHLLVYKHFVGPVPSGSGIIHIDGNIKNNHVDNLKLDNNFYYRVSNTPKKLMDKSEFFEILRLIDKKTPHKEIIELTGVKLGTLNSILYKKHKKHILLKK